MLLRGILMHVNAGVCISGDNDIMKYNRMLYRRPEKEGNMSRWTGIGSVAAAVIILVLATAGNVLAHCDTLDGPVVNLARQALAKGDVKIILPWVAAREKKAHQGESVEAGRMYVQAYVPYLHFVERLYNDAVTPIAHGTGEGSHAESGHLEPAAPATEHKH